MLFAVSRYVQGFKPWNNPEHNLIQFVSSCYSQSMGWYTAAVHYRLQKACLHSSVVLSVVTPSGSDTHCAYHVTSAICQLYFKMWILFYICVCVCGVCVSFHTGAAIRIQSRLGTPAKKQFFFEKCLQVPLSSKHSPPSSILNLSMSTPDVHSKAILLRTICSFSWPLNWRYWPDAGRMLLYG